MDDSHDPKVVLIVEDNETNFRLVRDLLEAKGLATIWARTGHDALSAAAERQPDLILMDIQLPDINGTVVVEKIRAAGSSARPPIVAVTALAMKGDRERFLASGFDDYVSKPIDIDDLYSAVERALGR